MRHINEQELIEYRYGDWPHARAAAAIERHLSECQACRENYQALGRVLAAVEADETPEPAAGYESRVWAQLVPRLVADAEIRRTRGAARWGAWREWLTVRRVLPVATVAALVLAAFLTGRFWPRHQPQTAMVRAAVPAETRERVLLLAVGEHLDRAQMVLLEISNAELQAPSPGQRPGEANISREQQRAEELLSANRIYRQTAAHNGDSGVASVLDELEPVLLEIAHSPSSVTTQQLEELQRHIAARGLLLKVRVLDSTVHEEESTAAKSGSQIG